MNSEETLGVDTTLGLKEQKWRSAKRKDLAVQF